MLEELRALALFEKFSDEQLQWVAEHSVEVSLDAETRVVSEGEPGEAFWILLEGEWRLTKQVGGREITVVTTDYTGSWVGGVQPEAGVQAVGGLSPITARVTRPSRLRRLPIDAFRHMLDAGFPLTTHLLAGVSAGTRRFEELVSQQEKLAALGKLSAGLAHELNNPAAAGRRAADQLTDALARQGRLALRLHGSGNSARNLDALAELQAELAERVSERADLDPISRADREDEVGAWLESQAVSDGWEIAPSLVEAGVDTDWLDTVAGRLGDESLADALPWLEASLNVAELVREVRSSTARISELVAAVKSYSYMDRAPSQDVDIHDGLETTLVILGHKLKQGVEVSRAYDRTLPHIPAYGSELNQVWTNLIDNAVDAMGGQGHLHIRTSREGDQVLVSIEDDGPGIPAEIQPHIFEPFFTTKGVGEGTGIGLDVVYRIIANHGGDIQVESRPGATRFLICLPMTAPDAVEERADAASER
jgi:signal transduction histidine kinase